MVTCCPLKFWHYSGFLTFPSQNCYLGGTFSTVNSQGVKPDYRVDAGEIPAAPHKQKVVIFGYLQNNVFLTLSDGLSFLLFRCFRFWLAFLKLPVTSPA